MIVVILTKKSQGVPRIPPVFIKRTCQYWVVCHVPCHFTETFSFSQFKKNYQHLFAGLY